MWRDGGYPTLDAEQFVHCHLGCAYRILDRKDDIVRDLDELAE